VEAAITAMGIDLTRSFSMFVSPEREEAFITISLSRMLQIDYHHARDHF
jgi:hypothetical protein